LICYNYCGGDIMTQSNKSKATFTIDPKVLNTFNELAEDISLNKSKWVERKMKEVLKEFKKEIK
jgi:predicted AAA+ superfamily ATPase